MLTAQGGMNLKGAVLTGANLTQKIYVAQT
ncbi:secreted effector protein PipB2 [Salmonella enterica subsp. enterica]|uniref:Secreted effector protein PipB2 n=1 Tax=Salmonella enterica I TaxID=59201 RepID=A0A379WP00_SALET|nr:secreted effector protein PipB2 [Salmonella enterica subsp. enterica]